MNKFLKTKSANDRKNYNVKRNLKPVKIET